MNTLPIAFTTLAFPDATLEEAISLGRSWGYAGVELRLIDGQVFDSSISAAERARVKKTIAASGLPIVIVDSMILVTVEGVGPERHDPRCVVVLDRLELHVQKRGERVLDDDAAGRRGRRTVRDSVIVMPFGRN